MVTAQLPSISTTLYRLFVVVTLSALLLDTLNPHGLKGAVSYITNYKFDPPPPAARPVSKGPTSVVRVVEHTRYVYQPAPANPGQAAALQTLASEVRQLRRELAKQPPKPATITLRQQPVKMALTDTTILRRKANGQLSVTKAKVGTFQDKWLTLTNLTTPGKAGRPDSAAVAYQIYNEYDAAAWMKRTPHKLWPFGKRRIYVSLTSRNPNAVDKGLDAIPVKKAKKLPRSHD